MYLHNKFKPFLTTASITLIVIMIAGFYRSNSSNAVPTILQEDTLITGNWFGTSICQQKNTACHDEIVIYHIIKTNTPEIYQVAADKIVNADTLNMGTLNFKYDKVNRTFICESRNGVFKFTITGNKMEGALMSTDNILFRKISLKKR